MKLKIGPIEIDHDPIKDEVLFAAFKESPKDVDKYLAERSKFFDLALRNLIAGRTMRMIRDFIYTLFGGAVFIGWSIYVFFVSKDAFVWKELSLENVIYILLQAFLVIFVCLLPIILIGGFLKSASMLALLGLKKKQ